MQTANQTLVGLELKALFLSTAEKKWPTYSSVRIVVPSTSRNDHTSVSSKSSWKALDMASIVRGEAEVSRGTRLGIHGNEMDSFKVPVGSRL